MICKVKSIVNIKKCQYRTIFKSGNKFKSHSSFESIIMTSLNAVFLAGLIFFVVTGYKLTDLKF